MATEKDLPLCDGCRDNFYNQCGKRCWSFEGAQVVEAFRIGWWTQPTSDRAYRKVVTLSCHYAPGQYAHHKEMPECFPGLTRVRGEEPFDARVPVATGATP